jgi:hypothetical protein
MEDEIREVILETIESSLNAQLRAVRRLRSPAEDPSPEKRTLQIDMVYDVLKSSGKPLHISEIISRVRDRFGAELNRESIVSSLSKKISRRDRFDRTDRNTFALREV